MLALDNPSQFTILSWYMHPDKFTSSALDHSHWTEHAEAHFTMLEHLVEPIDTMNGSINKLACQPHSQSKWNDFACNTHPLRKICRALEHEALKLVP